MTNHDFTQFDEKFPVASTDFSQQVDEIKDYTAEAIADNDRFGTETELPKSSLTEEIINVWLSTHGCRDRRDLEKDTKGLYVKMYSPRGNVKIYIPSYEEMKVQEVKRIERKERMIKQNRAFCSAYYHKHKKTTSI